MGFIKENKFQIIGVVSVIILFFCLRSTLDVNENFYSSMLNMRKDGKYSGRVIEKYIDSLEHNTPKIKLTNASISIVNEFWDRISVGDSVVKNEGEYFITVYKSDKTKIRLDYRNYFNKLSGKYAEQYNNYPIQKGLVNDYEKVLSNEQIDELNNILIKFDSTSQNKILLLSVKSYNENISFQNYVSDLAKRWHIDQNNNGKTILIVFSREKRKIAFTLGKGVNNFSEIQANEIISDIIPKFKEDEYYLGIKKCILEIIKKWE